MDESCPAAVVAAQTCRLAYSFAVNLYVSVPVGVPLYPAEGMVSIRDPMLRLAPVTNLVEPSASVRSKTSGDCDPNRSDPKPVRLDIVIRGACDFAMETSPWLRYENILRASNLAGNVRSLTLYRHFSGYVCLGMIFWLGNIAPSEILGAKYRTIAEFVLDNEVFHSLSDKNVSSVSLYSEEVASVPLCLIDDYSLAK